MYLASLQRMVSLLMYDFQVPFSYCKGRKIQKGLHTTSMVHRVQFDTCCHHPIQIVDLIIQSPQVVEQRLCLVFQMMLLAGSLLSLLPSRFLDQLLFDSYLC